MYTMPAYRYLGSALIYSRVLDTDSKAITWASQFGATVRESLL